MDIRDPIPEVLRADGLAAVSRVCGGLSVTLRNLVRDSIAVLRAGVVLRPGAERNEVLGRPEPMSVLGSEPFPSEPDDIAVPIRPRPYLVIAPVRFHRICRPFCDSVRPGAVFYTRYRSS